MRPRLSRLVSLRWNIGMNTFEEDIDMLKNFFAMKENDPNLLKIKAGKARRTRKLPEEWSDKETITIYRAGNEEIGDVPGQLYWTTNKGLAFWMFQNRNLVHVYQAEIAPKDVLSFENWRFRFKVDQYMSVRNVTDITEEALSDAGYELAFDYEEDFFEFWDEKHFARYADDENDE